MSGRHRAGSFKRVGMDNHKLFGDNTKESVSGRLHGFSQVNWISLRDVMNKDVIS